MCSFVVRSFVGLRVGLVGRRPAPRGRLHDVVRDFIDDIVDEKVDGQRGMKTRIFKGIADALHFSQSYMMAAHIEELSKHYHQQS